MNNDWDTPPDGDFVRYLERLTPATPGAVEARSERLNRASAKPSVPFGAPGARPVSVPLPVRTGPPDLADALKQLFGQVAGEIKKASNKR